MKNIYTYIIVVTDIRYYQDYSLPWYKKLFSKPPRSFIGSAQPTKRLARKEIKKLPRYKNWKIHHYDYRYLKKKL